MKKILITPTIFMTGIIICFLIPTHSVGKGRDDTALEGLTLEESLEVGIEGTYTTPNRSYLSGTQKYYLTGSSTINQDTTLKLRIGSLGTDYEDTKTGAVVGHFEFIPLALSLIGNLGQPEAKLKPYLGGGLSYYYFSSYLNKSAHMAYQYDGLQDLRGLHAVVGLKYLLPRNISVSLEVNHEWLNRFNAFNDQIDFGNTSIALNLALRF